MNSVRDDLTMNVRRILTATDFSAAARLAVARAGQLARQFGAHVHIVHVHPDWDLFSRSGPASADHYRAVGEHAERAIGEEVRFLESTFGVRVTGETRMGRASEVLRSAMAEFSPHLVVVGARGEHDAPALAPFLGGTALKLISFSRCAVLVVRNAGRDPYRVSLAAIEGPGAAALAIMRWARALAPEGECHLVHAFDAPYVARLRKRGVSEGAIDACTEVARESAAHFVDEVLSAYGDSKQTLNVHLVCGEPVSAILGEVARCKPEIAIVGRHEHPPQKMHLQSFGSVALRITYHAPGDILIVP